MDTHAIAQEIAAAVLAACAPGTIPTTELMVQKFTDTYERLVPFPSDADHQKISEIVGGKTTPGAMPWVNFT